MILIDFKYKYEIKDNFNKIKKEVYRKMKKILSIVLVIILLITGLVVLTGCTKSDNGEIGESSKGKGVDLKLDFEHMNNKIYNAHVNLTEDDKIGESDDEEPNFVRIENEKENYVLDLTLDTEAKEGYEQFKTSAKEDNEIFEEVKFGKYEGYYSDDNGDIYGYILLDDSDSTFDVFVMFSLYLYDENSEDIDVQNIYNSSKIQNILNNIEFKS